MDRREIADLSDLATERVEPRALTALPRFGADDRQDGLRMA